MRVEAGESPENVIRTPGFYRARIYEWLAAYREGGLEAPRAKPIPGRPIKLPAEAVRFIYETVTTKNPMQMEFEFALWARDMLRELIRERFAVRISIRSVDCSESSGSPHDGRWRVPTSAILNWSRPGWASRTRRS